MSRSLRLKGIPASPGIAISPAKAIDRKKLLIPKNSIDGPDATRREQSRLDVAIETARRQIQLSIDSLNGEESTFQRTNHAMILQTHLMLLNDMVLIDTAKDLIATNQINAEWALSMVADDIQRQLANASDEYLSERAEDIHFLSIRIIRNLLGHMDDFMSDLQFTSDCIIVTIDLSPAETAQMINSPVRGFATEKGTQTSHTAIMAQALGIPAVVGIPGLTEKVNPGDTLIIDGLDGYIVIEPDEETIERYRERAVQWRAMENRLRSTKDQPSMTTDGVEIKLSGNIELPGEAPFALDYGAQGIGLYRTEFLYLDRDDPPTRAEQIRTYASVIRTVAPKIIAFRTFDVGADKMPRCLHMKKARNPALGLRAIRLGLRRHRELLKEQIKAMILAAIETDIGTVKIMFPMVSGITELRQLKNLVTECRDDLSREISGIVHPRILTDAMIELPAAVFACESLARESDFFSIGTNDLIQYMLAIDRVNDDVAYLYTPFHPAALRALKMVVEAAGRADIPVSICGGAAGEPHMAPLLIGLGLRELSMAPQSIPFIKAAIRTMSLVEAEKLVADAFALDTPEEIEQLVVRFMEGKLTSDWN